MNLTLVRVRYYYEHDSHHYERTRTYVVALLLLSLLCITIITRIIVRMSWYFCHTRTKTCIFILRIPLGLPHLYFANHHHLD